MATTTEIEIKVTGLADAKAQLKSFKDQLITATDPEEINKLSRAAGDLKDRIKDANEQVNNFATGSKFEAVSNNVRGIGDSLKSLDFKEAGEKLKVFNSNLKNINSMQLSGGIKELAGSLVNTLGTAFQTLGKILLANPLLLLVSVIAAVVVAIVALKDKLAIAEKAFNLLFTPIQLIIDKLKELTDWMGITSFAADEEAEAFKKAAEKKRKASEETTNDIIANKQNEVNKLKAAGKDTTKLEQEILQAKIDNAKTQKDLNDKEIQSLESTLSTKATKEKEKIQEEINTLKDKNAVISREESTAKNDIEVKTIEHNKKIGEENKKAADKKKADDEKAAKDKLNLIRSIEDIQLELMKDGQDKELKANSIHYDRLIQDAEGNETKIKLLKELKIQENLKIEDKYRLESLKNASETEDLRISTIKDSFTRELEANDKKYNDLKAQTAARTDLNEQQKLERIQYYGQLQDEAETKLREDKAAKELEYTNRELLAKAELNATNLEGKKAQLDAEMAIELQNKELTESEKAVIEKRYANQKKQLDEEELQRKRNIENGKLDIIKQSLDLASFLVNSFGGKSEKEAKKTFELNKALGITQAIISTYQAATVALAAPANNLFPGQNVIMAGLAVAAGLANVAKIAQTKFETKSAPSNSTPPSPPPMTGPSISNSNTSQSLTPSFNLFGTNNNSNNLGPTPTQDSGNREIVVKAVVSESDITTVQKRITKIQNSAEL